ncbi:MAG: hypothetical protein WCC53_15385 [Thermoanaerobaculia bacterium]|jgi:hypothetical protein
MNSHHTLRAFLAAASLAAAAAVDAQGVSAQDLAKARADMSSRPAVSSIAPECLRWRAPEPIRFTVHGLNLGASQGGRSVAFTLGGLRISATIASWTNGRIDVDLYPGRTGFLHAPDEAAPIAFEIRSETGEAYPGTARQLHVCRTRFEQTIVLNAGVCTAVGPTLPVGVAGPTSSYDGSTPEWTLEVPSVAAGQYRTSLAYGGRFSLSPKRIAGCPEGHWEPGYRDVQPTDAAWQQTVAFTYVTPTRRVVVPTSTITTFVRAALAGTTVHLNNYGAKVGKSYLKRGDAWVKFGPAAGGGTFPIAIEEIRLDPPDPFGRILYYVKDVDSSGVTFRHDAAHYHLGIAFANDAEAIKGEHEGAGVSPSMSLNDAKLEVALHFKAGAGPKPDVVVDGVTFTARIEGGCNVQIFDVCGLVYALLKNGLPNKGIPGLEQRVKDALSDPGTRQAIGDAIWNGLDSPTGRAVMSNAAGGAKVSRLVRVTAASADGLEVEFVPLP